MGDADKKQDADKKKDADKKQDDDKKKPDDKKKGDDKKQDDDKKKDDDKIGCCEKLVLAPPFVPTFSDGVAAKDCKSVEDDDGGKITHHPGQRCSEVSDKKKDDDKK